MKANKTKKQQVTPYKVVVKNPDETEDMKRTEYIGFRWDKRSRAQLKNAKLVVHMSEGELLRLCFLKARKMVIEEIFETRKQAAEEFFRS